MKARLALALVFLGTLATSAAAQADPERGFHVGNAAFESGDFAAAIAAWEEALVEGSGGAALHYNLGTAYLRTGRPGPAIFHLRAAAAWAPRDRDVAANLALARDRAGLPARTDARPAALRWLLWAHERTTAREALALFAALWLLAFGLLHGRTLFGRPRSLALPILLVVPALLLAASLIARSQGWGENRGAVLLEPGAAWTGPSAEAYQRKLELPAGSELEVLELRADWVKIAAGAEESDRGWVPREQLGLLP